MRRARTLLALGPLTGTLGAFVGVAVALQDRGYSLHLPVDDLLGFGVAFYFLAGLATLIAIGIGRERGTPFHALKACAALAVVNLFPGLFMAKVIEGIGC